MGWTLTALRKGRPLTKHLQGDSSSFRQQHPPPGVCEVCMLIPQQKNEECIQALRHSILHQRYSRQQSYKKVLPWKLWKILGDDLEQRHCLERIIMNIDIPSPALKVSCIDTEGRSFVDSVLKNCSG
ncbi:hypothetical protein NPIL_34551 [Nephila pilipes]|uniref:Uncharacterized protein n=1 Tax=Nephila pilipes TaxID=299642 RepID=A0A8X6TCL1_NEPPI|nr:hypothetical protein NPIL_34551 [Nephila pilipes]